MARLLRCRPLPRQNFDGMQEGRAVSFWPFRLYLSVLVRILTSCTGEKRPLPMAPLSDEQLFGESQDAAQARAEAEAYRCPAGDLYTGRQHVALMEGVRWARQVRAEGPAPLNVKVSIVSAGFGLVDEATPLPGYESTFAGMRSGALRKRADRLGLPDAARAYLEAPAELTLVLLGDDYLRALALPDGLTVGGPTVFFAPHTAAAHLPGSENVRAVLLGTTEAKRYGEGLVWIKGVLASRLLTVLRKQPSLVREVMSPAFDLESALADWVVDALDPDVQAPVETSSAWRAQSAARKLKFFIPDWDDLVDPDYDFVRDQRSKRQGGYSTEQFAHQIYRASGPNYDGLLVSRAVLEASPRKGRLFEAFRGRGGVHGYLRIPVSMPVMGDCGAFSYVSEEAPPYDTADVLDYYSRYGFDLGISVDHLVGSTQSPSEQRRRVALTVRGALDFMQGHRARGLSWTPLAALQGTTPEEFADAARTCVEAGYDYLAVGGLVPRRTADIVAILEAVRFAAGPDVRLHALGIGRLDAIPQFVRLGVTSLDSATYLRKAWTDARQNYWTLEGPTYTALRVPDAGRQAAGPEGPDLKRLEAHALGAVRALDAAPRAAESAVGAALKALLAYQAAIGTPLSASRKAEYLRTLSDRPWKACPCRVCQLAGVETILFRGNNRNRRRGFHNTYVFYERLGRYLSGDVTAIAPWAPQRDIAQTRLFERWST